PPRPRPRPRPRQGLLAPSNPPWPSRSVETPLIRSGIRSGLNHGLSPVDAGRRNPPNPSPMTLSDRAPTPSASSSTTAPSSSSPWKDLPRRILTVGVGVPSIALLLRHRTTSRLFFQGAHAACLLEWRALAPAEIPETAGARSENGSSDGAAVGTGSGRDDAVSRAPGEIASNDAQGSSLSNCLFCLFSVSSAILTVLPTSLLPLGLLAHGIAVRLIPHFPRFQACHSRNATILAAAEHYQFGLLYLSMGFHFLLRISRIGGPIHIGNLFFIVWMSDTGALVCGRLMKRKGSRATTGRSDTTTQSGPFLSFLKSISPGKTVPGLLGALVTGPVSALMYPITFSSSSSETEDHCNGEATGIDKALQLTHLTLNHPLFRKAFLGLTLSLAGIVGDLTESSVKRLSKKKDSGGLLPGHGGVVDRFDSLLVAGVVYYYLLLA
ncbi:hypothetical protein ACHAWF_008164, partial [Thalassiosira exigua]